MDRSERFATYLRLLRRPRGMTRADAEQELEISHATFKRDLEYLRSRLNAPIEWNREVGAYRLEDDTGDRWELPGLWFTGEEIEALLTIEHLMRSMQPGLLGDALQPLRDRITSILEQGDHTAEELRRRIRVEQAGSRPVEPKHFRLVAHATLKRLRLQVRYYTRGSDTTSDRVLSPQRLVHYRDNWYLAAWCHERKGVRMFSVDAITEAAVLDEAAREVSETTLDKEFASSYGIFAGEAKHHAVLRFTPERARWVSRERWHPDQHGEFEPDGHYRLRVPYADHRELLMDVLKHGAEVEVVAPNSLRQQLKDAVDRLARRYR